ncbi:MAG: DUF2812 domain-containing protein [Bacillota bacterium]|nr:DUF2812 domain-containing protein [Bacillota bacterium]
MAKKLKKEHHWFALTDYEEEEKFLRKKHNAGYRLVKTTMLGTYYFEKCRPEDVVYKLDFNPQKSEERERYLKMFEDYGWEYIQELNEYSYFRKPAGPEDDDIFSDNESRLDMAKRIFARKMLPILIIFAALVIPQLMLAAHNSGKNMVGLVILTMWTALFVLYVAVIIHCGMGFRRLGRKYGNKKDWK